MVDEALAGEGIGTGVAEVTGTGVVGATDVAGAEAATDDTDVVSGADAPA